MLLGQPLGYLMLVHFWGFKCGSCLKEDAWEYRDAFSPQNCGSSLGFTVGVVYRVWSLSPGEFRV